MVNAETIQLTMLRAKGRRRDASALCASIASIEFIEIETIKSTGYPTVDLASPKLTAFLCIADI